MDEIRAAALISAAITLGVEMGVFQLYAYAIMPGLRKTDDRTFVGAFQQVDRAIINPWFMVSFFGALVFTGAACVLHLGEGSVLPWTAVSLALYLVVFVITITINVPLNDQIKAAGEPDQIDVASVREGFAEGTWARWNLVRAVLCTIAFGCLAWALVEYGRL